MSSLEHDMAWVVGGKLLEIIAPLLREEEKAEAFAEFYAIVKAGIEAYEIQKDRRCKRLNPFNN
jgi:hypothetical protein